MKNKKIAKVDLIKSIIGLKKKQKQEVIRQLNKGDVKNKGDDKKSKNLKYQEKKQAMNKQKEDFPS